LKSGKTVQIDCFIAATVHWRCQCRSGLGDHSAWPAARVAGQRRSVWQVAAVNRTWPRPVTVTNETPQRWHYNGDPSRAGQGRAAAASSMSPSRSWSASSWFTSPLRIDDLKPADRPAVRSRSLRIHLNDWLSTPLRPC